MEPRKFREEDRDALARMGVASFGADIGHWQDYYSPEKNPRVDLFEVYVIEEDEEARATAAVLPLEVFVDGVAAPMGGVAAVNTHPAYRRRGYAGELMQAALREMRGRGVHLSMLWPFAHAFYRNYGWELGEESIEYTLKPTDLPTSPEQKHLRAYRRDDLPRMMELLETEAARHPLGARRGEKPWLSERLWKGRETVVYEREGRVEGYLIYGISDRPEGQTPERELEARELIAASPGARAGLLSFMAAHDPLVFEVKCSTSRGEPLHPYLENSYVKAEIEPQFMLRIVDVKGALKLLNRKPEAPLVLEVADDLISENEGAYTVGGGEVVRDVEAGERVTLDVRQLAQLYAGYLPARQLARYGHLRASSDRALELLEGLFPAGDPWVAPLDRF